MIRILHYIMYRGIFDKADAPSADFFLSLCAFFVAGAHNRTPSRDFTRLHLISRSCTRYQEVARGCMRLTPQVRKKTKP